VAPENETFEFGPVATLTFKRDSKVRVIADVSATYASGDYMRRYYTVTASGSAASGLARFTAKSGVKDIGLTLTTSYQLTPKWSVIGFAGYKRLTGSAKDSPVVSREGNANQLRGGIGLGFSF
jgi:outer membrane scaffolding protein for murein synthesis (MipA/OmpV family)